MSKYTYTPQHHFKYLISCDDNIGNEMKSKINDQYNLFHQEYQKLAKECGIKNLLNMKFVIKSFVYFNESYKNFSSETIFLEHNISKYDEILDILLNKNKSYLFFNIKIIEKVLLYETCKRLKWIIF